MSALVMEPLPRQYVVFPLVVHWQPWFDHLSCYWPELRCGLATGAPKAGWVSLLRPPRQQVWQAFAKHFQPGELSQWQAYLHYLAAETDQDEQDLQAAIRGTVAPVLPPQLDREALWSLAHQLEETLAEKAAGLQRLAAQEKVLGQLLGEAEPEDLEILPVDAAWSPPLSLGPPDIPLARLRLQFWQEVLSPHLAEPWTMVVLEPEAGESSPRFLWQAAQDDGQEFWQARWRLPAWQPQPGSVEQNVELLELGVLFRKTLAGLLQALAASAGEAAQWRETLQRLVEERLWPASIPRQASAVRLEIYGWLPGSPMSPAVPAPMLFLSPAD